MEKKYLKICMILIVALLQFSANAIDGDKEKYNRDMKKTFDINSDALLEVTADFTSLEITNWDQNKIEIVVEVDVEAKSESEADKIFNALKLEMSGGGSNVQFIANLGDSKSDNNNKACNSEGWTIKAYIKAPKSISLELDMSFGDLEIDVIDGRSEIELSFGSFSAKALTHKENEIFVEFGDSNLDVLAAKEISVSFGSMDVERLNSNSEINASYSDVSIANVKGSVDNLELNCSFGSIHLTLDSSASFKLESNSSFGSIYLASEFNTTHSEKGMFSEEKDAIIGSGKGTIDIENSYGDVSVKVQ